MRPAIIAEIFDEPISNAVKIFSTRAAICLVPNFSLCRVNATHNIDDQLSGPAAIWSAAAGFGGILR